MAQDFIKVLQELRGTNAPEEEYEDGIYWDITINPEYEGYPGIYGHMLAMYAGNAPIPGVGSLSQLELIEENELSGWRILGRDSTFYGAIGDNAIDFSYSDLASTEYGAIGIRSFAEGSFTEASGDESHAEGLYTKASGHQSHSEGHSTIADGLFGHAEGDGTLADAEGSHAEGGNTIASGIYAHAQGNYTKAINLASNAQGMYNVGTSDETIQEIGIGTSEVTRKNAVEVYSNGRVRAPELTIALHDAPRSLVTKEYVDAQSGGGGSESELEKITEDGNVGHRILGKDPLNYGDTGVDAVDLSSSLIVSDTLGATGPNSFATGINTKSTTLAQGADTTQLVDVNFNYDVGYNLDMTSEIGIVTQPIDVSSVISISAGMAIMDGNDGYNDGDATIYVFDVSSIPIENQSAGDEVGTFLFNSSGGVWDANGPYTISGETSVVFVFTGSNVVFEPCSIPTSQAIFLAIDITNKFQDYAQSPGTEEDYTIGGEIPILGGTFTQGIGTQTRNNGQSALGMYNTGTNTQTILEVGIGIDTSHRSNALEIYSDGKLHAPSLDSSLIVDAKSLITKEYVTTQYTDLTTYIDTNDAIVTDYVDSTNSTTRDYVDSTDTATRDYVDQQPFVESDVTVAGAGSEIIPNLVKILQADYDLLIPDPDTLYFILPTP